MSYYGIQVGEDRALEKLQIEDENNEGEELDLSVDIQVNFDDPIYSPELDALQNIYRLYFVNEITAFEVTKFLLGAHIFCNDKELKNDLEWLRFCMYEMEIV